MNDVIKQLREALAKQPRGRYTDAPIVGSRFSKDSPPPDAITLAIRRERIAALKELLPSVDLSKVTDDELERMEAMVKESRRPMTETLETK